MKKTPRGAFAPTSAHQSSRVDVLIPRDLSSRTANKVVAAMPRGVKSGDLRKTNLEIARLPGN